jgi:DNA-binding response OmpR family regulator
MKAAVFGDAGASRRTSILCIDDDPQITEAIRIRLRGYELDVLCADHGMHGFWLAMTERPDLIITDMHMPQGAGDYVIQCLRNNSDTRSIPVIILTGQRGQALSDLLQGLDVEAVLTKPVLFDDLLATIATYIPLRERDEQSVTDKKLVSR